MSRASEANDEYSTRGGGSRGFSEGGAAPAWRSARRPSRPVDHGVASAILAVAVVAALLTCVAEFTTLYQAHIATRTAPIQSVTAGAHNSYSLLPIAALAAAFGLGMWRTGSRLMLLAIGVLGVVALLIALLHDQPDRMRVGLADKNSVSATTTPGPGLYLETLGAILLVAASGLGFIILGAPARWRRAAASRRSPAGQA